MHDLAFWHYLMGYGLWAMGYGIWDMGYGDIVIRSI